MPNRMPDRMPEDMSDRMPEDMPEDLPDRMPNIMSEDMSEDMPDRMPNRMSEDMSDRMPEDVPVRTCINVMVGITRSKVICFFLMPSPTKERNQRCNRCKAPPMRQATFSDNTNQPHSRYLNSRLSNTQLTTLFISFARRNNWAHSVFTFNNAGLLFARRGDDSGRYSGGLECWPCRCSAVASGNTNLPAVW